MVGHPLDEYGTARRTRLTPQLHTGRAGVGPARTTTATIIDNSREQAAPIPTEGGQGVSKASRERADRAADFHLPAAGGMGHLGVPEGGNHDASGDRHQRD